MRITCAYSGLDLQVSHFPAAINDHICAHPIFAIPQKKLLQYIRKWSNGELTSYDSYLLFLALLNSTDYVVWRAPATYTPRTDSIVAANMEQLTRVISYTNTILHPSFTMPTIVIDSSTCDLLGAKVWIANWFQCYTDFSNGYREAREADKIKKRETILQTFIKAADKPISHYAKILADWAGEVGMFPSTPLTLELGKVVATKEYWKQIIQRCCKAESIFAIPSEDLENLIQWCEINIDHGSIYSHSLMELLRAGASRQQNYLGLGDLDLSLTTYRIIEEDTSIETASRLAMIDSAPKELPIPSQYPSKLAYLRAKLKYGMAQEYNEQQKLVAAVAANTANTANTETIITDDGKEL
jgi:hypothetical protein